MADTLIGLAECCEKATGPDRELDARIWCTLNGHEWLEPPYQKMMPDYDDDPTGETLFMGVTRAGLMRQCRIDQSPRYTASLDAAMTLVPDDHDWEAGTCGLDDRPFATLMAWVDGRLFQGSAATPALALCAAALRARAAMDSVA